MRSCGKAGDEPSSEHKDAYNSMHSLFEIMQQVSYCSFTVCGIFGGLSVTEQCCENRATFSLVRVVVLPATSQSLDGHFP